MREAELIELLTQGLLLNADGVLRGVGDDCAVLEAGADRVWLVTVDQQIEGVHFLADRATAEDVGHKSLAVSLSDVAAMGGVPRHAFLTISLPLREEDGFARGFREGFGALARRFGVNLLGGDVARARSGVAVTVTVLGEAARDRVLYRDGARPGDRVYVTGTLGGAAAGLERLRSRGRPASPGPLEQAQLRPEPRVEEGSFLGDCGLATACIDVSDGLALDLTRLCGASGAGVRIEENRVPLSSELLAHCGQDASRALAHALVGGEDYELCFTVPAASSEQLEREFRSRFSTSLTHVGEILPREEGFLRLRPDGTTVPLAGGFDHFAEEESG